MLCLGIDPDMHDTAIASWDDQGPVAAHVVSTPRKLKGTDAMLAMMQALSDSWPEFHRQPPIGAPAEPTSRRGLWRTPDFCAVEGQELRRGPGAQHSRPQDIVHLGNVAGMCVMRVARGYLHGCGLYWPKPSEWKGSVAKHAMQARLYTELKWGYELRGAKGAAYATPIYPPKQFVGISAGQWKHVGDALLLARWCWEQASGRPWKG